MGREWGQNLEYIAKPIVKGLVQNNLDKIQAIVSFWLLNSYLRWQWEEDL